MTSSLNKSCNRKLSNCIASETSPLNISSQRKSSRTSALENTSQLNRSSQRKSSRTSASENTSQLNRSSQRKSSRTSASEKTSQLNRSSQRKSSRTSASETTSQLNRSSQRKSSSTSVLENTSPINRISQRKSSRTSALENTSPINRSSQRKSSTSNGPEMTSPLKRTLHGNLSSGNSPERTSPPVMRSQEKLSSNHSLQENLTSKKISQNVFSINTTSDNLMPAPIFRRPITAKKIMPRKTLAAIASFPPVSTPKVITATATLRRSSRVSPQFEKENSFVKPPMLSKSVTEQSPSKMDILSPIPLNISLSPMKDDRDKLMSQKVRRSYSRLDMSLNGSSFLYSPTRNSSSDSSTPNSSAKSGRRSLFGFNKLLSSETPEEDLGKTTKRDSGENRNTFNKSTGVSISVEEPDHNIPGVVLVKQKRRKRKIPLIEKSDLDEWAAVMNAEFEEAEKFDLFVE
ncbi:sororin [Pelobates cultripes]|nr:sororin [Pelobates cultripes]